MLPSFFSSPIFVGFSPPGIGRREAARVVTGELKSIDFAERKVTNIYPPTNKELACIYDEEVEDMLYERHRDLIQVTGRVLLDDQGAPKQIIDVTDNS